MSNFFKTMSSIKYTCLTALSLSLSCQVMAQTSPNGKIKAILDEGDEVEVEYKNGGKWIDLFSIDTKAMKVSKARKVTVDYEMLTGKRLHPTNQYRESDYLDSRGNKLFTIRVYNDGIAIKGQFGTVDMDDATNNWLMRWTDGYEGFFPKNPKVKAGDRIGYPALFEYEEKGKESAWVLISESNIHNNEAGSSMHATAENGHFDLLPDGKEEGGWQTFIIGGLSDIVESTLINDNSDPCQLGDISWIEPGVASWVYWAYNHGSNDYNIIKMYTDFAETLHLKYVLIDAEWDEMKDGKTVEDAVKYAISKGVKPMIWYNSSVGWVNGAPGPKYRLNKPEDREKEFAWCEKIGVTGVKIDFFSGDTNMNMAYMIDLLKCAAKHHLLVNFHGATIPRGWQRTYPNLMSTEGVYGAEWYNNVPTFTKRAAAHNATLPFTRNVIGPMDYTPCAFSDSQHPHITSNAHELALTVLYESGIQHLADRPESFLSQPQEVQDFLSKLPTAWEDTKLLAGYPGEYAVIARRSGKTWYVAGINGTDEKKDITFSLKSLKWKGQNITVFKDGATADQSWQIYSYLTDKGNPQDLQKQATMPRGGFIIVLQ